MDYVNEVSAELAKDMEKRFSCLPPMAGVLFSSVKAIPVPDGDVHTFEVRIGIQRKMDEKTGVALIKKVLEHEIRRPGFHILANVYRGSGGAARDEGDEAVDPAQA